MTSDLVKYAVTTGLEALTSVFHKVLNEEVSQPERSVSLTLPLIKKREEALFCGKYKGLRLLEHGMKVMEHILFAGLKKPVSTDQQQVGFLAGRSTTDAIFETR